VKKVYQQLIDNNKGDCMQAAVASLFDLELDEVPKFIELNEPFHHFMQFALDSGYEIKGTLYNYSHVNGGKYSSIHRLQTKGYNGIKGYFFASVFSPKYYDYSKSINEYQVTHAVLIDKDYNIVFDPNPNNDGLTTYPMNDILGYNGIKDIIVIEEKN